MGNNVQEEKDDATQLQLDITLVPIVGRGAKYHDQHNCMSVCLSAHISQTPHIKNFTRLSVHVTCGRGSVLLGWQCNMSHTSSCVDDVIFSYNGPNRSELGTTGIFCQVHHLSEKGKKSAVFDCILSDLKNIIQTDNKHNYSRNM